ncbi:hypothetical protein GJ744_002390 [Endocarpon pusillum]|uniref:Uncharacterized protein n=1 Tax=Endocarpon pusillum TaxID=364733 RepID=A0A8H7AN60_9EURO|nr:hypothetical protein GJ744_002390 [Endocarpon pusillum]
MMASTALLLVLMAAAAAAGHVAEAEESSEEPFNELIVDASCYYATKTTSFSDSLASMDAQTLELRRESQKCLLGNVFRSPYCPFLDCLVV